MEPPAAAPQPPPPSPPPRAFTQGVGTIFQFTGGILFIILSITCCGSGLLDRRAMERPDLTRIGWHFPGDPPDAPFYSAQRATSIAMIGGIGFALAVAGVGLGLQATRRSAALGAVLVSCVGLLFWLMHIVFFARVMRSWLLSLLATLLLVTFAILFALAISAWREMRRDPPPLDHEVLPPGYKVPYSWYHDDPPEVRLARELEQRRQRLAVQQKELEMLEEKLRKETKEK